jgi:hypothetical protein
VSLKDDQHRPPGSRWASVKDGWASTWWVERWGGRRGLLAAVTLAVLLFGLIFIMQDVLGWPSPANF